MTRLTPNMRDALTVASRQDGLRRIHRPDLPGADPWPAPSASIHALMRRGYIEHDRVRNRHGYWVCIWKITEAGDLALNPRPKPAKDTVRSLRANGDAVSRVMVGGVWTIVTQPEPEPVDVERLSPEWGEDSEKRWRRERGARDEARDLTGKLKAA